MPSGRVPIRPKLGYKYRTDSGEIMMIIKRVAGDGNFPFLALDSQGAVHKYTEKGRYFHGFGNHPLHLRAEVKEDATGLFYKMSGAKRGTGS